MRTKEANQPEPGAPRRSAGQLMVANVAFAFALLALICGVCWLLETYRHEGLDIPDEKVVATERLAHALAGPRYFNIPPGEALDEEGRAAEMPVVPHISPEAARSQMARVAADRNFAPEASAKLSKVIDRLVEEPKSRVAGRPHLNLLRLNLALDELK